MKSLGFVGDVNDKPLRIWKSLLGEKELLRHGKRKGPNKVPRADIMLCGKNLDTLESPLLVSIFVIHAKNISNFLILTYIYALGSLQSFLLSPFLVIQFLNKLS